MRLSFIVITYHRGEPLQACLASIYGQIDLPTPYEVIVIDNGGDAVIAPAPRADITLRVERPAENLGVTGGRNLGMNLAQGDYWIFLDDDGRWHDVHDAARLMAHLDADPTCGAVAVKVIDPSDDSVQVSLLPHPDKALAQRTTEPVETPYFYGGGHIIRADAGRKVGDYPTRFFFAMEEIDFSLRLLDAGYHILYDPAVAIYHHTTQVPRSVAGERYWRNNTLNKCRVAWRLLPQPFPLTTMGIWSAAALARTHKPGIVLGVWRDLWRERATLAAERHPISRDTMRRLRRIGARLAY